jgi:hypothetical protein
MSIGCDSKDAKQENTESVKSDNHMNYATENRRHVNVNCNLSVLVDGKDIIAEVIFTNPSKDVIPILKRNLLMEDELTWAAYEVTRQGVQVPYTGRTIKRGAPRSQDYYGLEANTSVKVRVILNNYYDLSPPGEYTVKYASFNAIMGREGSFDMESNCVRFMKK